jgi:uncharacterized protein
MDSVVHFEIPAKDPKRASAFYSKAFGWEIDQYPDFEYWALGTTASKDRVPTAPGAINGGMGKKGSTAPEHVTITIGVADIDATLDQVKKLGGKVTAKKTPIGDMGFSAYFQDTEGNVIGLYQFPAKM